MVRLIRANPPTRIELVPNALFPWYQNDVSTYKNLYPDPSYPQNKDNRFITSGRQNFERCLQNSEAPPDWELKFDIGAPAKTLDIVVFDVLEFRLHTLPAKWAYKHLPLKVPTERFPSTGLSKVHLVVPYPKALGTPVGRNYMGEKLFNEDHCNFAEVKLGGPVSALGVVGKEGAAFLILINGGDPKSMLTLCDQILISSISCW